MPTPSASLTWMYPCHISLDTCESTPPKDIEVGIKQRGGPLVLYRKGVKVPGRTQDETVLVWVFPTPGPEHERTPTRTQRKELKALGDLAAKVKTVRKGPAPLVFTATKREAVYFARHLDEYRRQAAERP